MGEMLLIVRTASGKALRWVCGCHSGDTEASVAKMKIEKYEIRGEGKW